MCIATGEVAVGPDMGGGEPGGARRPLALREGATHRECPRNPPLPASTGSLPQPQGSRGRVCKHRRHASTWLFRPGPRLCPGSQTRRLHLEVHQREA